jgi:hypothetical protein
MSPTIDRRKTAWLWKIPVIAAAYFMATMISGAIVTGLGMQFPEFPGQSYSPMRSFVAALVLAGAVYLLARGVRGSVSSRTLVLFAFTYISFCVNNQIEGIVFTTMGRVDTMLVFFIIPCALVAAVAALLVRLPAEAGVLETVFSARPVSAWWWRGALAWMAFPVIYHFFGMLIYWSVKDFYEGGELGLVVPSQDIILGAVTLRSLLFLLVTIPILMKWSGSRRGLIVALAAGLTAMVGLVCMIEAGWMPMTMRIVHGLEIAADSIVHAWVLVALLVPRTKGSESELSPITAA